jgi:hypothetical protein
MRSSWLLYVRFDNSASKALAFRLLLLQAKNKPANSKSDSEASEGKELRIMVCAGECEGKGGSAEGGRSMLRPRLGFWKGGRM